MYGDQHVARGSGLFIPSEGIACNHHFLLPSDGTDFRLLDGDYTLRVYAKRVDISTPKELMSVRLRISESQAKALEDENAGIYFDWGPDQQTYHAHIDKRHPKPMPAILFEEQG